MYTHTEFAIAIRLQSIVIFFLRQRDLIVTHVIRTHWDNLDSCFARLPCTTAVFFDAVQFVDHPLVAVHESRADRSNISKVKTGCVAALGFLDDFVADGVRSRSLFRAQLDGDVCKWCIMLVSAGEGVVAVDVGEEKVSEFFDLVLRSNTSDVLDSPQQS